MITTGLQAGAIFAVSIFVLLIFFVLTHKHTATGTGWLNYQGPVFIMVGVMYIALGLFMRFYRR